MNTTELVERASLGSLLLEPDQVGAVSPWLRESDFLYPRSQVTYRLITAPTATGAQAGIHDVLAAALADPAARLNSVAGPYLHELLASPGRAGRAVVYGRLVVEASVRRRLDELAAQLCRRASSVAQSGQAVPALAGATSQAIDDLDSLVTRLGDTDPSGRGPLRQPLKTQSIGGGPACQVEEYLVEALTDNPGLVAVVTTWLRPGDFQNRQHAGTYRSMLALAAAGRPVDHITVTSSRRDRHVLAPVEPAHLVATRPTATSHQTLAAARHVLAASLGRRGVAATTAIIRLVNDPTLGICQCVQSARQQLSRYTAELARWPSLESMPDLAGHEQPASTQLSR